MSYNMVNTNEKELYIAEDNFGFNLDYDAIHEGILRGEEDIRCGRYTDLKTGMDWVKRRLFDE